MLRQSLILIAILGLGILIGRFLLSGYISQQAALDTGSRQLHRQPEPSTERGITREAITALQQQLLLAEHQRQGLVEKLAGLQARLEELEAWYATEEETLKPAEPSPRAAADTHQAGTSHTSVETLIAAGINPELAELIQARLDEYDLQQLYLRDRANREGWINTARYNKERSKYQNAYTGLRGEIGDETYDRMLYAIGRANRVVVRDTMQNSPGEQYGLQAGDRIIEYAGMRIFTSNELNDAVTQGTSGAMVLVRIQRGTEQADLYLPRGPIGVRLASAREQP